MSGTMEKNRLTEDLQLQLSLLQDKCYAWLAPFVNVISLQLKSFKENKIGYEIKHPHNLDT